MSGQRRGSLSAARAAGRAFCLAALGLAVGLGCARGQAKYPELRALDGTVSVVTEDIAPGTARFFSFRGASGRTADFFVYRESDGDAHAALDACRTCARWKKGYRLEGDRMVCSYCGMRFELDALTGGIGSCVPIALPASRRGERLQIAAETLEDGLRYF